VHEGHNIILNASSMLEIEAKQFCFKTNPTGPFAITQMVGCVYYLRCLCHTVSFPIFSNRIIQYFGFRL